MFALLKLRYKMRKITAAEVWSYVGKDPGGAGDPDLWAEAVTDEEKDEALDHVLALLDLFTAAKEPELVELCEEVRDRLDGML